MSTIKVDTIATRTGSGNITLSNNVASLTSAGAISGTNITASGTLAVTGATTTGNITTGNTSIITAGRFISSQTSNDPWFKGVNSSNSETLFIKKDGQIYSAFGLSVGGTGAANTLDDYEEGTFTSTITFDDATDTSPDQTTTVTARYTKIGRICNVIWPQMGVSSISALNIGDIIAKGSLPFTASNNSGIATGAIFPYSVRGRYSSNTHDDASFTVFVIYNSSTADFQSAHRTYGGGWIELLGSSSYINASLTYETA